MSCIVQESKLNTSLVEMVKITWVVVATCDDLAISKALKNEILTSHFDFS